MAEELSVRPMILLVLATIFLSLTSACDLVRDDAPALLGRGRYVEAAQMLAAEEPSAKAYPAPRRARYALYRGLAHFALGDAPMTDRWLGEAKALYDVDPNCLSSEDAGRLLGAWTALGRGI